MLRWRLVRGFSLIEVMIVIALLVLLLVFALPAFQTMVANLRVRSVADSVLSGIQAARGEALRRNASVTFRLDSGTGGGWSVILADNSIFQSKAAAEGGSAEVALATGTTIAFNNLGRRIVPGVAIPMLNVDIRNPTAGSCQTSGSVRCLRIVVAIGGSVRLCDPARVAPDPQACP